MDCTTSTSLIMSYLDNQITPKEWADLQCHLDQCEDCREALTVYQQMVSDLETMELPEVSDKFDIRVMEAIDHSLYQKQERKWLGIREILISFGIYLTFLFAIQRTEWNILREINNIPKVFYFFTRTIGLFENLLSRLMMFFMYFRRLLLLQLQLISNVETTTVIMYFLGLVALTGLFFLIEGKLQKLINS